MTKKKLNLYLFRGAKIIAANMASIVFCANPGCEQPGTNKCSACKMTPYCGSICQTADWSNHKLECPGHLRKVGMANLVKAQGFHGALQYSQALRYVDLAITNLKQLKDRPDEDIDEAMRCKFNSLSSSGRNREALECAKEWYCLYLTKHTHPPAIRAGFAVIESCIQNKEYFDAVLYARTSWETITLSRDSHIPDNKQEYFTSEGAHLLAKAIWSLARVGGIPAKEQQEAGVEAIMLVRRALEIRTQLFGAESVEVAGSMITLADVLGYFNNVDDDEVLRLYEQAKAIFVQRRGYLSWNVATCVYNLANACNNRGGRAHAAHDLDRCVANLEQALPHFREAARIYRAINRMDDAEEAACIEENLQRIAIVRAAATRG